MFLCLHYLYSFEFALLLQHNFSFLNFARSFPKVGFFVELFRVPPVLLLPCDLDYQC